MTGTWYVSSGEADREPFHAYNVPLDSLCRRRCVADTGAAGGDLPVE